MKFSTVSILAAIASLGLLGGAYLLRGAPAPDLIIPPPEAVSPAWDYILLKQRLQSRTSMAMYYAGIFRHDDVAKSHFLGRAEAYGLVIRDMDALAATLAAN